MTADVNPYGPWLYDGLVSITLPALGMMMWGLVGWLPITCTMAHTRLLSVAARVMLGFYVRSWHGYRLPHMSSTQALGLQWHKELIEIRFS